MKFAAFFGKLWHKTQSATKKVWALVKLHKVVSIASAATVVVAGTTCAIVLPIALHNHEYSSEWTSDTKSHWHEAVCDHEDERSDVAEHTYLNSCDADCDVCGKIRSVSHTYDNVCDTTCNLCGATREVGAHVFFNICDTDCNICGEIREVGAHVYDDDCDTTCNACAAEREITHTFDNACDTACNVCDFTRTTEHNHVLAMGNDAQHWYECTECGDAVNASSHRYDNGCDADCNDCGKERATSHTYTDEPYRNSDKHWYECTECGVKKGEAAHEYTNACDASCNVCKAVREVPDHVYDNDCDTVCNVCDEERSIEHAYELLSDDDTHWYECSVCHVTKDEIAHIYDHSCDATCNVCGDLRDVADHPYKSTYTYDNNTHWYECAVCKQRKDVAVHVYTNDCDTTCNDCGKVRAVKPHVYTNDCDTTCNVCDIERTVEPHPYATTYTYDAENHWFVCEECGDITGVATHEYDNACDTTCNDCGNVREVEPHVYTNDCDTTCNICDATRDVEPHPYSTTYTTDAAKHWFVCEECGDITGEEAHEYDNACDTNCNDCGLVRDVEPHPYSTTYTTDAAKHWFVCEECGDITGEEAHEYDNACDTTCNDCGLVREVEPHVYDNACDTTCNVCNAVRTVEPHVYTNDCDTTCNVCNAVRTIEHDYELTWDDDSHWDECSVCHDIKNTVEHIFDNACDTDCSKCDYERVTTHTFDTCEDTECNECGAVREAEEHEYSGACDDTCEKCSYRRDVVDHVYDNTKYTIDETGHWYQCTGCNTKIAEESHNYDEKAKDDWYHWSWCSVCGYEKDDAVEHTYSEELTSEDGAEKHWKECTGCDSRIEEAEHHWNTVLDKDENSHWYGCIDCGQQKEVAGHDYPDEYVTDENGHWKDCKVCGYRDENAHDYPDEFETDKNNHWKNCTVCDYCDEAAHQNAWTYNESKHWYECEVCAKKSGESAHDFRMEIENDSYLKTPATESTKATYYKVCAECYRQGYTDVKGGDTDVWEKAKITPTINIIVSSKEYYDGESLKVNCLGTWGGNITIEYKLEGDGEFTRYTEGAIVNAGTYVIRVTAPQTVEYDGGVATVEVTIKKAVINLNWITPDSVFDGNDKSATVEIASGVVGAEDVRVIAQLISGDTTKQDQTIVYNAILSGQDAENYVINPVNIEITYTIDPCAHPTERLDPYGNCTLCGEYSGITQECGDDFILLKGEQIAAIDVLYCRFKAVDKTNNVGYFIHYYSEYGEKSDSIRRKYKAYIIEDGNYVDITSKIKENMPTETIEGSIYGKYIYMVITLDDNMDLLKFGIRCRPVE